jgi:hypothetical protein
MKRVQKMIIGVDFDGAIADRNALLAGTAGDTMIVDVDTGLAAVAGATKVAIATLCVDGDGRPFIEESDIIELRKVQTNGLSTYAASAPKEQVVTIPAISPSAGDEFEVIISDYNDYNYIVNPRRIRYKAVAGDTETEVAAGLAAAISDDVSMPNLSATSALGVLTVQGKAVLGNSNVINNFRADYEILFNIYLGEGLIGVATVATTPNTPDKGCGTFREVRKMEEIHKGYKGHLNRVIYPTSVNIQYKSLSPAMGGPVGYDLYVVEFLAYQHTQTEGNVDFEISTTIALPSGEGVAFETAFEALL